MNVGRNHCPNPLQPNFPKKNLETCRNHSTFRTLLESIRQIQSFTENNENLEKNLHSHVKKAFTKQV